MAGLLISAAGIVFIGARSAPGHRGGRGTGPEQVLVDLEPGGAAGESPVEATAVRLAEEETAPPSAGSGPYPW